MSSLRNKVQLIGRLGQDPEIVSFNNGGKIAKFSLAIDDSYKDQNGNKIEKTYWQTVIVRNGLVKVVENYLTKGKEVAIEGKLTNRSWEDTNGKKQYVTEVFASDLVMFGK